MQVVFNMVFWLEFLLLLFFVVFCFNFIPGIGILPVPDLFCGNNRDNPRKICSWSTEKSKKMEKAMY